MAKASPTAQAAVAAAPTTASSEPTRLIALDLHTIELKVEGTSPLKTNRWSEKAIRMIIGAQGGEAKKGKQKKVPEEDYQAAYYRLPDGSPGFPILAFKAAAVTAVTSLGKEFTKVAARQSFHILHDPKGGELTEIFFPEDVPPRMAVDMVRVGMGTADVRYRPEFLKWGAIIRLQFNRRAISQEQVVNLINLGGFAVGVGEHRPEKDGQLGRFAVVSRFSWE